MKDLKYGDYQMKSTILQSETSLDDLKKGKIDTMRGEGLECEFTTYREDFIGAAIKGIQMDHVFKPGMKILIEIKPNPYRGTDYEPMFEAAKKMHKKSKGAKDGD